MVYNVIITNEAFLEVKGAVSYYKEKSDDAAARLYQNVMPTLEIIESNPEKFEIVRLRPAYRKAKVVKFPYLLIYKIDEFYAEIIIVACIHE